MALVPRLVLLGLPLLAACVGDFATPTVDAGRAQGELGGACFPNGTCNAGLVCVVPNTCTLKDAGVVAETGAPPVEAGSDSGASCPLIAWWPADDDPSDVGNTYNLSWIAGPSYESGAFNLTGTNFLAASKKLSTQAITVEARIRPIMVGNGTIFATDKADSVGKGFWFGLDGGQLFARVNKVPCRGSQTLAASMPHHVAVTYASDTCTFYVDGNLDQTVPASAGPIVDELAPYVGANAEGIVQTNLFYGTIDDLAVWRVALPAPEIAKLAATPGTKCK